MTYRTVPYPRLVKLHHHQTIIPTSVEIPDMKKLPLLSSNSAHHADCCAALSSTLVATMAEILPPKPGLTVSIGSGTGLLEALLLQKQPALNLEAVEVNDGINRYLPDEKVNIVSGTWDVFLPAGDAIAWIFIYPRELSLIHMYIERISSSNLKLLIWLGPCADFPDIKSLMSVSWKVDVIDDSTLEYETLAIWRRIPDSVRKIS